MNSPTVGRPAQGFNTDRAQQWVLAAALIVSMTYALRRIVEPSVSSAPARGSTAHRVTGAGSPPPSLAHWSVAYGAAFTMLALMSVAAPELAASLAMLTTIGTLLANGTSIVADIAGLEGAPSAPTHVSTYDTGPGHA